MLQIRCSVFAFQTVIHHTEAVGESCLTYRTLSQLTLRFSLCSSSLLFPRGSAGGFQLSEKTPEELAGCEEAAALFWKVLLLGSACWQDSPVFDGGNPAAGWGMSSASLLGSPGCRAGAGEGLYLSPRYFQWYCYIFPKQFSG